MEERTGEPYVSRPSDFVRAFIDIVTRDIDPVEKDHRTDLLFSQYTVDDKIVAVALLTEVATIIQEHIDDETGKN